MSAEKFFLSWVGAFLFVFWGLFLVLVVGWALIDVRLWCASAWFVVRFNIVWREVAT